MSDNRGMVLETIKQLTGQANVLTVPRAFIDFFNGDLNTAVWFSQCLYWSDRAKRADGYFYKSYREWKDELGINRYRVDKAIKDCSDFLEIKKRRANGAPTKHYRVRFAEFNKSFCDWLNEQVAETDKTDLPLSTNGFADGEQMDLQESDKSLTETTTDTTAVKGERKRSTPPHPTKEMQLALIEVMGLDPDISGNWGKVAKRAKELAKANYTPDQVRAAFGEGGRWWTDYWKGEKGDLPNLADIQDQIGLLTGRVKKPKGGANRKNETIEARHAHYKEVAENG